MRSKIRNHLVVLLVLCLVVLGVVSCAHKCLNKIGEQAAVKMISCMADPPRPCCPPETLKCFIDAKRHITDKVSEAEHLVDMIFITNLEKQSATYTISVKPMKGQVEPIRKED